jgi:hypothetical protein
MLGWGGMDWIHLARDRHQGFREHGSEHWSFIKCWEIHE